MKLAHDAEKQRLILDKEDEDYTNIVEQSSVVAVAAAEAESRRRGGLLQ